jgi:hypothetical protein
MSVPAVVEASPERLSSSGAVGSDNFQRSCHRSSIMMISHTLIDVLGWIGAIALLIAYMLVSTKRVEGDSTGFQLLNIVGSIFLIINTFHYGAYPSGALNIFWMAIALYTIRKTIARCFSSVG